MGILPMRSAYELEGYDHPRHQHGQDAHATWRHFPPDAFFNVDKYSTRSTRSCVVICCCKFSGMIDSFICRRSLISDRLIAVFTPPARRSTISSVVSLPIIPSRSSPSLVVTIHPSYPIEIPALG